MSFGGTRFTSGVEVKFTTGAPQGATHYSVSGRSASFEVTWYSMTDGVWSYYSWNYRCWRIHGVFTPAGLVEIR